MRVDQDRQHAFRFVGLDEPHAAHVARQVVDLARLGERLFARRLLAKVQSTVVHIGKLLVPLVEWLDVDGANPPVTPTPQVGDEVAADETTRPPDHDEVVAAQLVAQSFRHAPPMIAFQIAATASK